MTEQHLRDLASLARQPAAQNSFHIACENPETTPDARVPGVVRMQAFLVCDTGDIRQVGVVTLEETARQMARVSGAGFVDALSSLCEGGSSRTLQEADIWQVRGRLLEEGKLLVVEELEALDRLVLRNGRPCVVVTIAGERLGTHAATASAAL